MIYVESFCQEYARWTLCNKIEKNISVAQANCQPAHIDRSELKWRKDFYIILMMMLCNIHISWNWATLAISLLNISALFVTLNT